eukprot:1645138-Lingulodinium_polyedra.AAC.1
MPSSKGRVEKDWFCPVTRLIQNGHAAARSTALGPSNPIRPLTDAASTVARETDRRWLRGRFVIMPSSLPR